MKTDELILLVFIAGILGGIVKSSIIVTRTVRNPNRNLYLDGRLFIDVFLHLLIYGPFAATLFWVVSNYLFNNILAILLLYVFAGIAGIDLVIGTYRFISNVLNVPTKSDVNYKPDDKELDSTVASLAQQIAKGNVDYKIATETVDRLQKENQRLNTKLTICSQKYHEYRSRYGGL
ncbi:MAG: hypothetical protein J0M33_13760 [Anaerolineae bacterium]|nr:hypothetical protein [Anaerolineae bacterium]